MIYHQLFSIKREAHFSSQNICRHVLSFMEDQYRILIVRMLQDSSLCDLKSDTGSDDEEDAAMGSPVFRKVSVYSTQLMN